MDEQLKALIAELSDAEFECGEWIGDYEEDDYETMSQRAQNAQKALLDYIQTNYTRNVDTRTAATKAIDATLAEMRREHAVHEDGTGPKPTVE